MSDDFYPFVDSGDPAPDNRHLTGRADAPDTENSTDATMAGRKLAHTLPGQGEDGERGKEEAMGRSAISFATRISVYDDMLSTPRVIVIEREDVRTYLEEITNTVYRTMKEQGGNLSLMVIRELVENFIHARFTEPVISILDGGNTIRFADQGPGIQDKDRAFEFGVTSANREQKRYIRGTGSGLPMVQQYLEHSGGAISIEDNLNRGTVVTVSIDPERVAELNAAERHGAVVRGAMPARKPAGTQAAAGEAAAGDGVIPGSDHGVQSYVERQTGYQAGWQQPFQQPYPPTGYTGEPYQGMTGAAQQAAAFPGNPAANPMGEPAGQPMFAGTNIPMAQGIPQGAYPAQGVYPGQTAPAGVGQYGMPAYMGMVTQPGMAPAGYNGMPAAGMVPGGMMGMPGVAGGMANPAQPHVETPYISERGMAALNYLYEHGSGGPTDLMGAFGESTPTWSRELNALTTAGLVRKQGQKRILTDMGRIWLENNRQA